MAKIASSEVINSELVNFIQGISLSYHIGKGELSMIYTMGIDIGTSGTKTIIINRNGDVIASHTIEYPLHQPKNGYAEQNPTDWYNAVIGTMKISLEKSGISPDDLKGIGLSGQMHGLVMLDEKSEVIRPAIIWCDGRASAECDEITHLVGEQRLLEITANPAIAGFTAAKIMWVKKHEPENYARCKKILLPKDYIRYMLTSEFATEVSDASGMQLLDIKNRCWSDEVLEKLNISKSMLAKVHESPEVTGETTQAIQKLTGVKAGTIVVGGAGDNAAAAVGTGIVSDGKAFTTIGTSGVLFAHTSSMKLDPMGRVHTFCCAVPNEWHVMGVTQGAGLSMQWFRNNFCTDEIKSASEKGIDSYKLLDKMADSIGIGADKLIYLPYLMGERTPHLDTNARGVFFGISAIHTKSHFIRAVLEGVSCSLRDCKEVLKELDIDCDSMMICGGGAKSSLWKQILADLYQTDVIVPKSSEGASLGVAILALVGAGEYSSVQQACSEIIKGSDVTAHNRESSVEYNRVYDMYCSLYPALKQSYAKLANM